MTKKKILVLALTLAMVAILAVGGSLAYFTSEDKAENTFTMGNVQIAIREVFDEMTAQLIPGKDINKDVFVKNTGALPAYVRVHIAIPANLDDGDPTFAAINNFLHFNFTEASVQDGQWSWLPEMSTGVGYKGNGKGNWNFYTEKVNDILYNVYVVTYRSVLAPNTETTTQALDKVYLDRSVDAVKNEDGTFTYNDNKGNTITLGANDKVKILVVAEGTQTEGFSDPYTALNTAFGVPGTYNPFN